MKRMKTQMTEAMLRERDMMYIVVMIVCFLIMRECNIDPVLIRQFPVVMVSFALCCSKHRPLESNTKYIGWYEFGRGLPTSHVHHSVMYHLGKGDKITERSPTH